MIAALRNQGFVVYVDTTQQCPPQIAYQLANIFFSGPHENIPFHQNIARTQGQLYCEIDKKPAPAEASDETRIKTYTIRSKGIEVVMANVACRLYANASNRAERREHLVRAFLDLRSRP